MADKKPVYSTYVSPEGIAQFCWLDKPDKGFDGKATDPKFKVRVIIEDTPDNRAKIDAAIATGLAEAKRDGVKIKKVFGNPFKFPEDQDEDDFIPAPDKDKPKLSEEHRGMIFFDTKTSYKPGLIDTLRADLPEGVKIMSGDRVKIKAEVLPYEGFGGGLSLRLKVVQLIAKNTTFVRGKVNTDGFDDVKDGYVADRSDDDEDSGSRKRESF